jgi:hypothetical membrane protein
MYLNKFNRKNLILAGIIGPVLFFVVLTVLGSLWEGYNPVTTGMSEIGAVDSTYQDLMNYLGFSLLGVFIVLFGIGFNKYFGRGLQLNIACILILLGGIFMFAVGFFPCDAGCVDVTLTGKLHSATSTVPAILIPFASMITAYPISKKWGYKWGYISFGLGVLALASGPVMLSGFFDRYTGLVQRIGIGFSMLWIFLISIRAASPDKSGHHEV